jgi:ferredoxin-NADP reductase
MTGWKIILKARQDLCKATSALYFEKPSGFDFQPGQFANFTLLALAMSDSGDGTRALSIASAPHEADLMIATRMRDTGIQKSLECTTDRFANGCSRPFW